MGYEHAVWLHDCSKEHSIGEQFELHYVILGSEILVSPRMLE